MNNFYSAAGNPTTTARELATELGRFAADLKETANKLREELANIEGLDIRYDESQANQPRVQTYKNPGSNLIWNLRNIL